MVGLLHLLHFELKFQFHPQKEKIEGFEESPYSKSGEKKHFFNLGFSNRWQKILPKNILFKLNNTFQNDLNDLGYHLDD